MVRTRDTSKRAPRKQPQRGTPVSSGTSSPSVPVTDRHLQAAADLFDDTVLIPQPKAIDRIAQSLAALEQATKETTRTVLEAERQVVGDTDRWLIISATTPSGKAQFVCRSCGRVSPAPTKTCAASVRLWTGEMRACADWKPPTTPFTG